MLPYVPSIFELIQRSLTDDEKPETVVKLALGLIGDLADTFSNGQLKQVLLADWVALALRNKSRLSPDAKKTLRWAKEVGYTSHFLI